MIFQCCVVSVYIGIFMFRVHIFDIFFFHILKVIHVENIL